MGKREKPYLGFRCHEAEEATRKTVAKSDSLLPNPYGDESSFGQVSESALSRRVRIRDSQRVFWTRISTLPTTSGLRTILSVAAICYVVVLFSGRGPGNEQVGVALFALSLIHI